MTAILPPMRLSLQHELFEVYQQEAASVGRDLEPGEGLGLLRDVVIADSDEEAMAIWRNSGAFVGATWFAPFGFGEALREPGGALVTPEEQIEQGSLLVGTVDSVTRAMERLLEHTPVRWIFQWQYNGLVPSEQIQRSIREFKEQVLPRVTDVD